MSKSKCTCTHKHPSQNVRAWNFTHDATCHYAEVRKQEAQARANNQEAQRLYKHYQRSSKSEL